MRRWPRVALAVALLTLPQGARAESVTLEQAFQRMMSGGIEFGLLEADLRAAAEVVTQAKGQRRPRVALNLSYDNVQQSIISTDNTAYSTGESEYPRTTVSLTVRQPLFDAARWRQLGIAESERGLTEARTEVARGRLVRELVSAFSEVAQAQYGIDRARAVLLARGKLEASLRDKIAAGRATEGALLDAQGETLSAQSDLTEAEIDKIDALSRLQALAGPDVTGVSLGANRIGTVDLGNLTRTLTRDRLLELSPDMAVARAELAVAEKRQLAAKGKMRPVAELSLDVLNEQTDGSLFGGGSEVQTVTAGIDVTVPIYEGGINRSLVREAGIRIDAAKLRVTQTEQVVLTRYDALMDMAGKAGARVAEVQRQLGLAESALTAADAEVKSGRTGIETFLEREARRNVLRIEAQAARLRLLAIQAEVFALFGALDTTAVSSQISG